MTKTERSTTIRGNNNGNDDRRPAKKVRRSPRLEERAALALVAEERVASVVRVLLLQTGLLPWRDAMALGGTCRDARVAWIDTREAHMLPLLNVLEGIVQIPKYSWVVDCGPGLKFGKNYKTFSNAQKCQELVSMIWFMITNLKDEFCLKSPSDGIRNFECNAHRWDMGRGFQLEGDFLHRFHRRGTFAANVAIFRYAMHAMERGGNGNFNAVFTGRCGAHVGEGLFYNRTICYLISTMFPFRDQDLANVMRSMYPSPRELEILGPILTKKVVLMEPFFRWVPPLSGTSKDEEGWSFDDLPTPFEKMTDEIVVASGMGRWLTPHGGVDY